MFFGLFYFLVVSSKSNSRLTAKLSVKILTEFGSDNRWNRRGSHEARFFRGQVRHPNLASELYIRHHSGYIP
jgi:hypothetical protein